MVPTKFQSTYEPVIRFKGQNIIRQYVKGTPIQWISSCDDGEIQIGIISLNLICTQRRNLDECSIIWGVVVLSLTEKLKDLNCQIFCDNYFNSPLLHAILYQKKIFCAGTVCINRKNVSKKKPIFSGAEMVRSHAITLEAIVFSSQNGWTTN